MKAWLQLISIGMVGALAATSCVIVDDDDDNDDLGDAGDTSTGGRATGGANTGGRATGGTGTGGRATGGTSTGGTSTGGTSTGGVAGSGGEGGEVPDSCEDVETEPLDSCVFEDPDACASCLSQNCCAEVSACYGTEPLDVCGYPIEEGEFECARSCLAEIAGGGDFPNDDDVDDCIAECMKCLLPSPNTGPLVVCMNDNCPEDCY